VLESSRDLVPLAVFCGQCSCGCPTLLLDRDAPAERRLVLEDDFGASIALSVQQFSDIISQAQDGTLTRILESLTSRTH
jgi:hypothetical protein